MLDHLALMLLINEGSSIGTRSTAGHTAGSPQRRLLVWIAFFWTLATVSAISHRNTAELEYISPVLSINHVEHPNGINLELSISSDSHVSNLARRWYVQFDPNNAKALNDQYKPSLGSSSDSLALYTFLTRNNSQVELPQSTLKFKLTLAQQEDSWTQIEDQNGVKDESLSVLEGNAYRSVQKLKGNKEVSTYSPVGWARIVVSNSSDAISFMGSWLVDDESNLGMPQTIYHLTTVEHLLATLNGNEKQKLLDKNWGLNQAIVWRDADIDTDGPLNTMEKYGEEDFEYLNELDKGHNKNMFRRDSDVNGNYGTGASLYSTIGDTSGCPKQRMVSLTGAAVDCNFMKQFNSTQSVRSYLLDTVSQSSRFFEQGFNITLGLKQIIMPNSSECAASDAEYPWNYQCVQNGSSMNDRLDSFTDWRKTRSDDGIATWTLFTDCGQASMVGIAWAGLVCQGGGTSVVTHSLLDAHVLAHELGHSFGAVHDCDNSTCSNNSDRTSACCPGSSDACMPSGQFLMNPSTGSSQQAFSPCTQGNVCSNIARLAINSTCLLANAGGINLISENVCGNGIVEEGEECDCGGVEGCKGNPCCDPLTCKYTEGSQCDDTNEQCCTGCKFASTTTHCREPNGPCDMGQVCPGNSATCPGPRLIDDGASCQLPNNNATDLQCSSGHCTSRDLQCQLLMANGVVTVGGYKLNLQKSCDSRSCQISCADPAFQNNCFILQRNYIDGTPCAGTGTCRSGQCVGGQSSFFGSSGDSDDDDGYGSGAWPWWKYIVIALGSFVGLSFFVWLLATCSPSKKKRRQANPPDGPAEFYYPPPLPPSLAPRYTNFPPPPPVYSPPPPAYLAEDQSGSSLELEPVNLPPAPAHNSKTRGRPR